MVDVLAMHNNSIDFLNRLKRNTRTVVTSIVDPEDVGSVEDLLDLEELDSRNLAGYIGPLSDGSTEVAKKALEFLARYDLVPNSRWCETCNDRMVLSVDKSTAHDKHIWRCKRCRKETGYGEKKAIRAETYFENRKLTIQQTLFIAADWVENPGKSIEDVVAQFKSSKQTVVDLQEDFRRMTEQWFVREGQRHLTLGGPGKVVEIDETLVVRAKYHRGRNLRRQQIWVFGMLERGSKKVVMFRVPTRDAVTLLPIIEKYVLPGTTIMSDGWPAYTGISNIPGFAHGVVNHKYNFVNPNDRNVHTQGIEATWNALKSKLRNRFGTPEDRLNGHMFNYMWRRFYNKEKLLNRLLIEMGSYRREDSFEDIHFSDSSSSESSPERSSPANSPLPLSPSGSSSPPDSPSSGASSPEDDDGIYVRDEDRNKKIVYQEKNSEDDSETDQEDESETDQEDESETDQEDESETDQEDESDTESEHEPQNDSEPDQQQEDSDTSCACPCEPQQSRTRHRELHREQQEPDSSQNGPTVEDHITEPPSVAAEHVPRGSRRKLPTEAPIAVQTSKTKSKTSKPITKAPPKPKPTTKPKPNAPIAEAPKSTKSPKTTKAPRTTTTKAPKTTTTKTSKAQKTTKAPRTTTTKAPKTTKPPKTTKAPRTTKAPKTGKSGKSKSLPFNFFFQISVNDSWSKLYEYRMEMEKVTMIRIKGDIKVDTMEVYPPVDGTTIQPDEEVPIQSEEEDDGEATKK